MDEELVRAAARAILDQRGWCVIEACVDIPNQVWDARLLVFGEDVESVIDAVAEEIECEPEVDLRLTGCCRRTLTPNAAMGAHLCYVAPSPALVCDESGERGDEWAYWTDDRR